MLLECLVSKAGNEMKTHILVVRRGESFSQPDGFRKGNTTYFARRRFGRWRLIAENTDTEICILLEYLLAV